MNPRERAELYGQGGGGGDVHPIPPMHPGHPEDTPVDGGGWGPSDEPVTAVRHKLAAQRQATQQRVARRELEALVGTLAYEGDSLDAALVGLAAHEAEARPGRTSQEPSAAG